MSINQPTNDEKTVNRRIPRRRIPVAFGYLWSGPNTIVALAVGLLLGGRFETVDGVVEIEGPRIAAILSRLPVPAAAMTVGHVVFGRDRRWLQVTRKHERVHVAQYTRWGPFFIPAYLIVSAGLYARGKDGYRGNPFEVEAYAADEPKADGQGSSVRLDA